MTISVVIPVFNAERTIKECLLCLTRQSHRDYEVILVDNNSTDSSRAIIEQFIDSHDQFNARLLSEPKQGACAARNSGASAAKGDIIANIDPDCLPSINWLSDMADAFKDSGIAALAGNIEGRMPENLSETFSGLFTLPGIVEERICTTYTLVSGGYATANLAVRKDWFEKIGGFDESLNYKGIGIGEDHDLCARIYAAGGTLMATPRAKILHWHRSSILGIARQGFIFGIAQAVMLKRHGKRGLLMTVSRYCFSLPAPFKGWLDLNLIDRKLAILIIFSMAYYPLSLLIPAYLLYQALNIYRRAGNRKYSVTIMDAFIMLPLMLAKALGMTSGRIRGSFRNKVLCI